MKVLILGAAGMLGNAMFRLLSDSLDIDVYGSVRSEHSKSYFKEAFRKNIIAGIDIENHDTLVDLFGIIKPDVVINCIGIVKQISQSEDYLKAIPINSLLPHRLAALCRVVGARLIHISTDCVFSGQKGNYIEDDFPDAEDLYGRSKLLGEVNYCNAITLRTSIIGHEIEGKRSLIGWFLGQKLQVKGYSNAIFSGLPTVELSQVIRDYVLPRKDLCGMYHVAAAPINKYDLLQLVANVYGRDIEIFPDFELVINRSLNADRFSRATGYVAPSWSELIKRMYDFK